MAHQKIKYIIITIFLINASSLLSQGSDTVSRKGYWNHEIGGFMSYDSGTGFSYRVAFKERIKLQLSAFYLPIRIFSKYTHFLTIGLSSQFVLYKLNKVEFYAYLGKHSIHTIDNSINPLVGYAGSGVGIDIAILKNLKLQLQLGYAVEYMNFNKLPAKGYRIDSFGLSPGIGMMYRLGKNKLNNK